MKKPIRFAPLEVVLVVSLAISATFALSKSSRPLWQLKDAGMLYLVNEQELAPLAQKYGPQHHSRNAEEWIIRDFFNDRRNGVFLDVGANHYRNESNTYFLEAELGWSGIAVDALPEFGPDYTVHRPRTRYIAMFASDVDDGSATLFEPAHNKLIASQSVAFTKAMGEQGEARTVPTTTLNRVLEAAGVDRIDFLSMDIELAEPKALAGFDVGRYQPALVCIEAHAAVRQQILDYFAERQYVVIGKYLRIDPMNLYFRPLASGMADRTSQTGDPGPGPMD